VSQTTKACSASIYPKFDVDLDPVLDLKSIGGEVIKETSIPFFPETP